MLNGIAPILIFHFIPDVVSPSFNALSGIPLVGEFIANNVGFPIPLYLDQKATGAIVESESKALDIETTVRPRFDGKPPEITQSMGHNLVSINMVAQRDSIFLAAILALNDVVFTKIVAQTYKISYLNGPTVIFGGLLHGFSSSVGIDDDMIRMTLQIHKPSLNVTKEGDPIFVLPKTTGATPIPGGA